MHLCFNKPCLVVSEMANPGQRSHHLLPNDLDSFGNPKLHQSRSIEHNHKSTDCTFARR